MTDYKIPCETIGRLANVINYMPPDAGEEFRTIRIEAGMAIVTNRIIMAVEKISDDKFPAVHFILDPAVIEQCRIEGKQNGVLTVTVVEALGFATAKTTGGWIAPNNLLYTGAHDTFDDWHKLVKRAATAISKPNGAMVWGVSNIANLGLCAPSGRVIFPAVIDTKVPIVIRDMYDPRWFGIFYGHSSMDEPYDPAKLPEWFK